MQLAFEQLSDSLDASLIQEWTEQERVAMEKRGEHLRIYDVKSKKCALLALTFPTLMILIYVSTDTHGNPPEIIGNRSAAGKPIWDGFRSHGRPCH